ncbi:MAG TPA: helix-turn-helix transcriptional regulator [Stenomitos sp.]
MRQKTPAKEVPPARQPQVVALHRRSEDKKHTKQDTKQKQSVKSVRAGNLRKLEPARKENYCLLEYFLFAYDVKASELAEELDIPRRVIAIFEKGWPLQQKQKLDMEVVFKICGYFNCRVEQFLLPMTAPEAERIRLIWLMSFLNALPTRGLNDPLEVSAR